MKISTKPKTNYIVKNKRIRQEFVFILSFLLLVVNFSHGSLLTNTTSITSIVTTTAPPVLNSPIYAEQTSISGTGGIGTVTVYVDGNIIGTTTGSNWTISGLSATDLHSGSVVTSTNTENGNTSDMSNSVTVQGAVSFCITDTNGNPITTQLSLSGFDIRITAMTGPNCTGSVFTNFTGTVVLSCSNGLTQGGGITANFIGGVLTKTVTISGYGTGVDLSVVNSNDATATGTAVFDVTPITAELSSNQTICFGTSPSALSLSTNLTTISKWQKASDSNFTTPIDIVNTTTTLTGTDIGNLTATTYFRAIGLTGSGNSVTSNFVKITVIEISTAPTSVVGISTICIGSSTTLTATGGIEASGAFYEWGTGSNIGNDIILGENTASILVNPSFNTIYWVRRKDTSMCNTITLGKTVTVSVNSTSTDLTSIEGASVSCIGTGTTLTATGGEEGTRIAYEWGTGNVVGSNVIIGQTDATLFVNPTIATIYWVRRKDAAPCNTITNAVFKTISVSNPSTPPTSISGAATICAGTSITLTANGGTGIAGSFFQWGSGAIGSNVIAGQTGSSIIVSPLATTTYWVRRYDGGMPCEYTAAATTTVSILPVAGNPAVFGDNTWNVYGFNGADLTLINTVYAGYYTVNTLGDNTLSGSNSWANAASPSASSGWTGCPVDLDNFTMVHKRKGFPCGTYALTLSNWDDATQVYINGTLAWSCEEWAGSNICSGAIGTYSLDGNSTIEIRVREDMGLSSLTLSLIDLDTFTTSTAPTTISGTPSICPGSSTILTASGGSVGTIGVYQWGTGSTVGLNSISGQSAASLMVSPALTTTYWVRRIDGTCNTTSGISQEITVIPASVGGNMSSNQSICLGTSPADLTLSGYTGTIVKWQKSSDSEFSSPIDIANTSATLLGSTIGQLNTTTYFRAEVISGNCASSFSNYAIVSISTPSVGGTIASNQSICLGTLPSDLTLSGNVGNVLKWQKSSNSGFTSPTDISNSTNSLAGATIGTLSTTTYFRALIQNNGCTIVNSSVVFISIYDNSEGGTISGNQAICSGTSPSNLSLSGNTGNVIQWQKSTDSSFSTIVAIANTTNVLTGSVIGNLNTTTYFRALIENGNCSPVLTSNYVTVLVNTVSVGGSVASNQTIGYGTSPSNLLLSGNTGAVLRWQKASNVNFSSPTDITNTSNTLLGTTIGNLTTSTYFRAEVQSGICLGAYSDAILVTVNTTTVGGIISPNQTICTGTAPGTLTLSGYTGDIQRWESANEPTFSSPTTITNTTTTLSGLSALTNTTYYRAVVQNGILPEEYSSYVTVTVSEATVGGLVSSNQTICSNSQPNDITLSGYTGTILKWQSATNADFISPTDIFLSTSATLTGENMGNLTSTTFYRAVVKSGTCASENSDYVTITITAAPVAGTVTSSQTICTGDTPSNLTLSGNSGSVLKWQFDFLSDFSTAIDIVNSSPTLFGESIENVTGITYYRAVVQNGACPNSYSSAASITVTSLSIGGSSAASSQTICTGTTPSDIVLLGHTGNVVKWQQSSDVAFTSPLDITNTSSTLSSAMIGNLSAPTYFRAVVQNGSCAIAYSNFTTIGMNNVSEGGTVLSDQSMCSGSQPSDLTLSSNIGTVIKWQKATDSAFTTPTDIANTNTSLTGSAIGSLTNTTYFRAIVQNGNCTSANSNYATITIMDLAVGGTVSSSQAICSGSAPSDLILTAYTGNIIKWQSAVDSAFSAPLDLLSTSSTLSSSTIGNLTNTTYFRAVVQNGACSTVYSNYATISINLSIGGTISGSTTICLGTEASDLVLLNYSGNIIKWQKALDSNFTSSTDIASTAATLSGATIGNIEQSNYFRAIVENATCGTVYSSTASILTTSTTWNGTAWNNGLPTAFSTVIISGDYTTSGGSTNLYMCSLTVNNNAVVSVVSGHNFIVTRKVTVAPGAVLSFENNANLIQTDNITNSGNAIFKRDASLRRLEYIYWCAPVANQNLLAFSPLTLSNRFYTYSEPLNAFTSVVPSTTSFGTSENQIAGKGFMIRAPNTFADAPAAPTVFHGQFNGIPNNGTYTTPISYTSESRGYNLIGNPYPSPIDAELFLQENPGSLYFWTHTTLGAAANNYASFTAIGGTAAIQGGSKPNGTIQTGQGFLLHTTTNGNATFTNNMRVINNQGQFYRNSTIEKHRIWLNLNTPTDKMNQIMVGYMEGATQGYDVSIDGELLPYNSSSISSRINNSNYVIQGRALPFSPNDIVPLVFNAQSIGDFSIAIDHVDGLFSGSQEIFIKDNLLGIIQNIKAAPYTFTSDIGLFYNRFELVYNSAPLSTQNPIFDANNVVIYKQDGFLHIDSGLLNMKSIKIVDIRGRLLYEKKNIDTNTLAITDFKAAQQVLIVQITSDDDKTVSKKIIY